jgi:hypothetical protein
LAITANAAFDERHLNRSSVLWLIDGDLYSDHSRELLLSMCRAGSRRVRRKGAAPLNGAEEQTTRAISAYAQYA